MNPLGTYNPADFSQQNPKVIDAGLPPAYIRIINSSPYGLYLSFGGMGDTVFPEMFLEDFAITKAFNGKITFYPISNIVNPGAALTNYLAVNAFYPGEIVQPQAQPLTTMSNLGNTVPLNASATSVANDGNPGGTQFIEATPSGGGSSTVKVDNSGNAFFAGTVEAGTVLQWENGDGQLASNHGASCLVYTPLFNPAGTPVGHVFQVWNGASIINPFAIGGGFAGALSYIDSSGDLVTANVILLPGANIFPQTSGAARNWTIYGWDGASLQPAIMVNSNGSIQGHVGGSWSGISFFSGTGSGPFAHGLGVIPRMVVPVQDVAGTQTMGFVASTMTNTTVTINTGAGNHWSAIALA